MASILQIRNDRGPLKVSGNNARYFTDNSGKALFLAGFHTWYTVQDGGGTNPPPVMDWSEYLAALVSYGCNFTKLWAMESNRGWSDTTDQWFDPVRYERTGPGDANDGYLKVDLTQVSAAYLKRLRDRALDCRQRGIYVCVQLFQGWQIETTKPDKTGDPVTYHPYLAANNINSVDGDNDDDGELIETHWPAAQGNNVLSYQQALVDAIIAALGDLDNVIWEVSNEDTNDASGYNTDWQEAMITYIKANDPKGRLVGMTVQYPNGNNANLDSSGADWVSYNGGKANAVHAATDPVSMYDTDHTVGLTTQYAWIWTSLCEGHGGAWYMDPWDGALYGTDTRENATYQRIRANLGYALALVKSANLTDMVPQDGGTSPCTTGFCLYGNQQWLCYQPNNSNFDLDLSGEDAGQAFLANKVNTADGSTTSEIVAGGDVRTIAQPGGWTSGWATLILPTSI